MPSSYTQREQRITNATARLAHLDPSPAARSTHLYQSRARQSHGESATCAYKRFQDQKRSSCRCVLEDTLPERVRFSRHRIARAWFHGYRIQRTQTRDRQAVFLVKIAKNDTCCGTSKTASTIHAARLRDESWNPESSRIFR